MVFKVNLPVFRLQSFTACLDPVFWVNYYVMQFSTCGFVEAGFYIGYIALKLVCFYFTKLVSVISTYPKNSKYWFWKQSRWLIETSSVAGNLGFRVLRGELRRPFFNSVRSREGVSGVWHCPHSLFVHHQWPFGRRHDAERLLHTQSPPAV